MTSTMMEYFPLKSAYLCQDCENVGNCATQCPACASSALLSLSSVVNREVEDNAGFADTRITIPAIVFENVRTSVRAA
ncbi:MAG: hypothetical protein KGN79_07065 [Acidobacteriota bacterium]|nr:hypothetical protein [Acidobacteriota bacterium]